MSVMFLFLHTEYWASSSSSRRSSSRRRSSRRRSSSSSSSSSSCRYASYTNVHCSLTPAFLLLYYVFTGGTIAQAVRRPGVTPR
jgi:hypothetical protein